jgi:hypothetical protein
MPNNHRCGAKHGSETAREELPIRTFSDCNNLDVTLKGNWADQLHGHRSNEGSIRLLE